MVSYVTGTQILFLATPMAGGSTLIITITIPCFDWDAIPKFLIFCAGEIDSRYEEFSVKLLKKDLVDVHNDFISDPRPREFVQKVIDKIRTNILKYDVDTLKAMRETNSTDYKIWCGDIVQYFYYKMIVFEPLHFHAFNASK